MKYIALCLLFLIAISGCAPETTVCGDDKCSLGEPYICPQDCVVVSKGCVNDYECNDSNPATDEFCLDGLCYVKEVPENYCGDGLCNGNEDVYSCYEDCNEEPIVQYEVDFSEGEYSVSDTPGEDYFTMKMVNEDENGINLENAKLFIKGNGEMIISLSNYADQFKYGIWKSGETLILEKKGSINAPLFSDENCEIGEFEAAVGPKGIQNNPDVILQSVDLQCEYPDEPVNECEEEGYVCTSEERGCGQFDQIDLTCGTDNDICCEDIR